MAVAIALLMLPALAVHAWMAWTFPSYRSSQFGQDLVFTFAWCALLVVVARRRLLWLASTPLAVVAYFVWLFLVLGEGVSYYLQADTFNARFFANLNLSNLHTGLRAFPAMIGGGLAVLIAMIGICALLLVWVRRRGDKGGQYGPVIVVVVILLLTVLGVDSVPRRLIAYLGRVQQATHFADTPQGQAVADLLDLHPVSPKHLVASAGKNLVFIYLESVERVYWDPKIFPGLTPNLDRLRKEGLDFSGLETFSGASYTIAGMFASQCGVPLFTSPFAGLDEAAGNDNDAVTFHPKIACLGNVLHRAGYTQVYIGGAPIQFSNKGLFYRLHGYNEALGLNQLETSAHHKLAESGWGLYDSELFGIALAKYQELDTARKPFNLSMITLDTHPPDGRPSPGCPKYAANPNSMLQAVHCTDYEVGKFVAELKQQPNWKNTVVVIMSDHLMMRNDAEPLYPKDYYRRPALLVLNAGHGVRSARMYHMDVAPTVLNLLGVGTNATFIAGADRSASNAASNPLVDNPVADSVLRKALWSRVNEFKLCKRGSLVDATSNSEFDVGGRELNMSYRGVGQVGLRTGQVLDFFIDNANAKLVIADAGDQAGLLATRADASVLMVQPLPVSTDLPHLFSVDWLGLHGARARIADVPSLRGLSIRSPHCGELMAQVDAAPAGTTFDFSHKFQVTTAEPPVLPSPPDTVKFTKPESATFARGLGWMSPQGWGSYTIGRMAALEFRMPQGMCHGASVQFEVDPYLTPSRPNLDAQVWVNGRLAKTWRFKANGVYSKGSDGASDSHDTVDAGFPVDAGSTCIARVELHFSRPGAKAPPYPKAEDSRPLQLRVLSARAEAAPAPAPAGKSQPGQARP